MPAQDPQGSFGFWTTDAEPLPESKKNTDSTGSLTLWTTDAEPLPQSYTGAQPVDGVSGIGSGEAFGDGVVAGPITGDTGILSEEAFGADGALIDIFGAAGIPSAEAFGAGGSLGVDIAGATGIPSEEAFGTDGLVAAQLSSLTGIPSEEAFGSDGVVAGPITGDTGIPSAEAFGDGDINGPVTGTAGIPSGEAFSTGIGVVAGPITGSTGIPSAEAFGSGGAMVVYIIGVAGISSGEAFGSGGTLGRTISGYAGIPSEELVSPHGTVFVLSPFQLFLSGQEIGLASVSSYALALNLNERSTLSFQLTDEAGAYRPLLGEEVVFLHQGVRYFCGVLQSQEEFFEPSTGCLRIEVKCDDSSEAFDRRLVTAEYQPTDLHTLLADLIENHCDGEGITYVPTENYQFTAANDLKFNGVKLREALTRIAQMTGLDYRVNAWKALYMEHSVADDAPFLIREGMGNCRNMRVSKTLRQYRNVQGVRTSRQVRSQVTDTFTGDQFNDGYENLSQVPMDLPVVLKDGVFVECVRASEQGSKSWQFVWYEGTKRLAALAPDNTTLTSSVTIEVRYPTEVRDVVTVQDSSQIDRRRRVGGNSGRYETIWEGPDTGRLSAAEDSGDSLLDRMGAVPMSFTFETDDQGLDVGQILDVDLDRPLFKGAAVVVQLSAKEDSKRLFRWAVTATAAEPLRVIGVTAGSPPEIEVDGAHNLLDGAVVTIYGSVGDDSINVYNNKVTITGDYTFTLDGITSPGGWAKGGFVVTGMQVGRTDIESTSGNGISPITINTVQPHNRTTGETVTVWNVGGNTNANGTHTITVTGPNSYTVPGTGNGNYTGGGTALPGANGNAVDGGALHIVELGNSPVATPVVTTGLPHNLTTGDLIAIAGAIRGLNGQWGVDVLSPTTFGIQGLTTPLPQFVYSGYITPGNIPILRIINGTPLQVQTRGQHGLSNQQIFIRECEVPQLNREYSCTVVDGTTIILNGTLPFAWPDSVTGSAGVVNPGGGETVNRGLPRPRVGGVEAAANALIRAATRQKNDCCVQKYKWLLASAIPGFASRPLQLGDGGNPYTLLGDGVLLNASIYFSSPPIGSSIIVDLLIDGVSIFPDDRKLEFLPSDTQVIYNYTFKFEPFESFFQQVLTCSIVQVGSSFGGCNGEIVLAISG